VLTGVKLTSSSILIIVRLWVEIVTLSVPQADGFSVVDIVLFRIRMVSVRHFLLGLPFVSLHSLLHIGVDQALQFTIVLSTGAYLSVSAYSYPSLFWALRGGGGGSYGIVTSVTYKTHPETPLTSNLFLASIAPGSNDGYKKLVAEFIKLIPTLSDAGWTAYGSWTGSLVIITGLGINVPQHAANATWDPFYSFAQNLAGDGVQVVNALTTPFDSWNEWYKSQPVRTVGANTELGSRLVTRKVIETKYNEIADIFVQRGMIGGLL
jgi:hypothetical protein